MNNNGPKYFLRETPFVSVLDYRTVVYAFQIIYTVATVYIFWKWKQMCEVVSIEIKFDIIAIQMYIV